MSQAGAPKPWRPAGAVSMFGQVDPSALIKKTASPAADNDGGHTSPPSDSQQEDMSPPVPGKTLVTH